MNDNTKIRPAEEIAREIIELRAEPGTMWLGDRRESIILAHRCADSADAEALVLRVLARLYERGFADGAAAERERFSSICDQALRLLDTGLLTRAYALLDRAVQLARKVAP